MANYYNEELPEDLAKVVLADRYDDGLVYRVINDTDGTYVAAYSKATGERVSLSERGDGIPDDLKLNIEEEGIVEDAFDDEEDNTYSGMTFGWWKVLIALSVIIFTGACITAAWLLLR